jgi:electron transfer flavoprotein alpha subunit
MSGNIWVIAEHWQGAISDVTFELMAMGRQLADGLGCSLEAVLLGHGVEPLEELGAADGVLLVDDPALAEPIGGVSAGVVAGLAGEHRPAAILLPITNVGWDLIGILPARASAPLINFVRDAVVADGRIHAESVLYGGKMRAAVAAGGDPILLAVRPGARPAEEGRRDGSPPVERIGMAVEPGAISLVGYREPAAGDVDLTQQEVLIGVGRGIGSDANLEVAEELAEAVGGAVCGSRPVIDQGWLPLSRQVGKSGVTVKPRAYVAAGISGAPEHVEGITGAELIVAINTDPDAPIFGTADYGVVGDATDVLEAIVAAVQERKG